MHTRMEKIERWFAVGLTCFFILCTAAVAIISSVSAYQAWFFPYDDNGHYYDGTVVHHENGRFGWAVMAISGWLLTLLLGWSLRRIFRPAETIR